MRENWQSRKGFIFAAVGAAVGLGNLWRFPFQAYKNWGSISFTLFRCVNHLRNSVDDYGRKIRGGSVEAFSNLNKKFEVIGWVQVMIPIIVMTYYCAIIAVSGVFMVYSLGLAFGLINWLSNPGPLMGMVAGSASNALDLGSVISIFILIAVVFVCLANWLIVRKGISGV